jgi:hypothetical protein
MICIELRVPKAAFLLLMLCAPIAIGAPASTDFDHTAAAEQRIQESIASELAAHGAHSETLIPLITQLGHLYRESGLEAPAVVAFEEARGVVRANYGLSSLEEAPLVEELIRVEEHMGYVQEPWQLEHELLALAAAHPDELRSAEIYRELGDKRIAMLNRYLAGEFPPQLILGCYYHRAPSGPEFAAKEPNCTAGGRGDLIRAVTSEAWSYYSAAIKTLMRLQLYSSTELHELETRIVRDAYGLQAYSVGRRSLLRLLSYDVANDEPPLARVDSLLKVADWDMVTTQATHSRLLWEPALDTYEQAYAQLQGEGVDAASIDALFAPEVPVVLPTFAPNPLASQPTPDTTGYIDVAFEVTKFGRARRVRLLDTTRNASRDAEKDLVSQISRSVFRPRLIDGRVADAAPVVMRYYVSE